MFTLNHVLVHDEMNGGGAHIEGRTLGNGSNFVDVIVSADGTVIGRELADNGARVLTHAECLKLIGILGPPAHVMQAQEIGDSGFYRMPALHNWIVQTHSTGCHEYTTEDRVVHA